MSFKPLRLNKIFFTSPTHPTAEVILFAGLNVVYGGSNAGKSFTLKAIDFMLGAKSLKVPEQGKSYTDVYLWVTFADGSNSTLRRSVSGGDVALFDGHIDKNFDGVSKQTLAGSQESKSKTKTRSVSDFIFENIGMPLGAQILKNETGEKVSFSLRMLSRYLLVGEESMVTEKSPLKTLDARLNTEDKSVFRFLLTGKDDSAIGSVTKSEALKASREGKIEVLEEMVAELEAQLQKVERAGLSSRLEEVNRSLTDFQQEAQILQAQLDLHTVQRRAIVHEKAMLDEHLSSHARMFARFEELRSTYISDVDRLEAIQEGSVLFSNASKRPCAVCGADETHQHHFEDSASFAGQTVAAEAEIKKIRRDIDGLDSTVLLMNSEVERLKRDYSRAQERLEQEEEEIERILPLEGTSRIRYEGVVTERTALQNLLSLFQLKDAHDSRIAALRELKIGKQRAEGLPDAIGSSSGSAYSKVVLEVLAAWKFPNIRTVDFDFKNQDIVVNGKERSENGKGIRAILHSAMKVALLVYCEKNKLPHPGFVVLDSPLLTYRSPLKSSKHGDLQEDEKELSQTALNEAFYSHLDSLSSFAQFLVFENQDPPESFVGRNGIQTWSGENGVGRQGLFPESIT